MNFNLDQVMQTFIQEARELLQTMEESLLHLEGAPEDADTIDAVFRAAHTIKGSAGLFGLTPIVSFTHILEDVLDRLRDGAISIDKNLIALLLQSGDHLTELLNVYAIDKGELSSDAQAREIQLRAQLQSYQANQLQPLADTPSLEHDSPNIGVLQDTVTSNLWHISLRFGSDVFRNGMDPISFLRYLNTLGTMMRVTTLFEAMPAETEMDPESCYLGFEIDLDSNADKTAIADVFRFVEDDCLVRILPPHSKITEYIELINALPEDAVRLGEILLNSGALTPSELEQSLQQQRSAAAAQTSLLGDILVAQHLVEPVVVQAALDKQTRVKDQKSKETSYIRVQADKLDQLINLIGELVIASAGASLIARNAQNAALYEATSGVIDLVEEIRDGALRLRMVPIGDTFNRFQRVVRDVSNELGKDIDLQISGADTEVDKTVVEKISDPLMHLLRNSMDHGIESPERRLASGKPARGTLKLNAYHDSGSIVIDIIDDGGGLNRERILQKAIERELISANTSLADQDIYKLIFEPGFSTAEAITNLSGRGVGMDVVKRNITALRGTIDLDSNPGQGTRVSIRLPLTLAIIDGFLVGVGQASYVVPLDMVRECVELNDGERTSARERNYLNLRGEVLPLIFLRSQFNLPENHGRRENVVVVRTAGQTAGLVVDELQGEFQTVIKPLGKLFTSLQGISGSTILGNGAVALILDIPTLVQKIIQQENRSSPPYSAPLAHTG
ncbi:MAG TPA: chemotaxis protein CheA [Cellvibrio sp.]|nr:chemotaxis protein CheA [Cellvibrio sp.]